MATAFDTILKIFLIELLNKLHFLYVLTNKCSLIIRYFVVCGIEDSSSTDQTLNPDDEFGENHLTSSTFS